MKYDKSETAEFDNFDKSQTNWADIFNFDFSRIIQVMTKCNM